MSKSTVLTASVIIPLLARFPVPVPFVLLVTSTKQLVDGVVRVLEPIGQLPDLVACTRRPLALISKISTGVVRRLRPVAPFLIPMFNPSASRFVSYCS